MAPLSTQPAEENKATLRRERRRLRPAYPLRLPALGEGAEMLALGLGMLVMSIWKQFRPFSVGEGAIVFFVMMLYLAFALHLRREGKSRAVSDDRPAVPPAPAKRGPGRPPVNPTGHSEEAARRKSRQLHELRDQGIPWKEAARQVELSEKQAQRLYRRAPHLTGARDR